MRSNAVVNGLRAIAKCSRIREQPAIEADIVARHALGGEAFEKACTDDAAVEFGQASHGRHGLVDAVDDEAGHAVLNHFRHGAVVPCDASVPLLLPN